MLRFSTWNIFIDPESAAPHNQNKMKFDPDPTSFGPGWEFTWRDACLAMLFAAVVWLLFS